jgi:Uma2 family endonuclease
MGFFKGRKPAANEQRVILPKISWQKLELLLQEMGSSRSTHLTYDQGRLELVAPLAEHERSSKLVESLLLLLAEEMKLPIQIKRPLLLKRFDLQQAIEPDLCCYLGQTTDSERPEIRPDLILEISLNPSQLPKLPIYANFAIPEVWRYVNAGGKSKTARQVEIHSLQNQSYREVDRSLNFPFLTAATVLQFLDQSDTLGLIPALRLLRDWLEQQSGIDDSGKGYRKG